ncbi:ricin-type beta-trefoil lectin domain protein [Nonomuraea sp. NPDC050783]|uniref:RICIN domain-containing protein n=1 Tax=Nonomuraea sp. NPDC050783 TaxID=3154634 RepID=UPI0034663681
MPNGTTPTRRSQRRWGARGAYVIVGVLLASLALVASPANAYPPNPGIIRNWATGRCLDSNFAGQIYTLPCNNGNFQLWQILYYDGSWWRIRNYQTGLCIDGNNNSAVYMSPCQDPNLWQKWSINWREGAAIWSNVTFKHATNSWCLDSNGAGAVYTQPCNGGGFQDWRPDGYM